MYPIRQQEKSLSANSAENESAYLCRMVIVLLPKPARRARKMLKARLVMRLKILICGARKTPNAECVPDVRDRSILMLSNVRSVV